MHTSSICTSIYGNWAASGEIDIMEACGQASLGDTVEGTLHYGAAWPNNVNQGSGRKRFLGMDFSAGMHDFAVEWTSDVVTGRPKLMRWLVDGNVFYQRDLSGSFRTSDASPYTAAGQPWDERFHLLLNGEKLKPSGCWQC
jgi:beta-glucanase (GH16 family)